MPQIEISDVKAEVLFRTDKAEFRLRGRDSQKCCVLLKTDGGKGWVDFSVWLKNGGTDKKRIEFTAR